MFYWNDANGSYHTYVPWRMEAIVTLSLVKPSLPPKKISLQCNFSVLPWPYTIYQDMIKVLFQKRYRPENELDDDGSSEKLLGAHSQPSTSTTRSIDAWTRIWWPWVAHGIFFTLYTVVFVGMILHTYDRQTEATKKLCLLQHSTYCESRWIWAFIF